MILCDAGVLLCLVDRTQPQHVAYQNAVMPLAKPLVTTWSCLTEAMYLALHRGGWGYSRDTRKIGHDVKFCNNARFSMSLPPTEAANTQSAKAE